VLPFLFCNFVKKEPMVETKEVKIINEDDYLFFKQHEDYFNKEHEKINYDQFIQDLKDNKIVGTHKQEIRVQYNEDKTKLTIICSDYSKRFVHVKKLKRVVPVKYKSYSGITFDLKHKNFYAYSIDKKTNNKKIRCNVFDPSTVGVSSQINFHINYNGLGNLLGNHLGLPGEYFDIKDILYIFYLKGRNIEYFDEKYLPKFFSIFNTHLKKNYKNKNIFEITKDILNIKNIEYVKSFYEERKGNVLPFFYYLKVYDILGLTDDVNKYNFTLNDVKVVSVGKLIKMGYYVEKLNQYYKFNISDFHNYENNVNDWLQTLYVFLSFGKKINIERHETFNINFVYKNLLDILSTLFQATYESGAILMNQKGADELGKILGNDYRVETIFNPKILENYTNIMSFSNSGMTLFNVYKDKQLKILNFDPHIGFYSLTNRGSNTTNDVKFSKDKYIKLQQYLKKFELNFPKYIENFSVNYRFCENHFVDLCNKEELNYKKYIKNIWI